ncbi:DUF4354 family protein [Aeromonas jandaei]|uniref:DUF4354 family protein n=1 Tax=Aeromonas jandaei TaxID=650 RepID=UPI003B9EDD51
MKTSIIIAFLALTGVCLAANAAPAANIAVYATEQAKGSISVGKNSVYTKSFEVTIIKLSADTIDLSNRCLRAYSLDGKEFNVDTVDEVLASGFLKEGKPVKGVAMFSSDSEAVLNATLVKISDNCEQSN